MAKKIYLAGKISSNDWRGRLVKGVYETLESLSKPKWTLPDEWPVLENAIFGKYDYAGPYFFDCNHNCFYGPDSHGVSANKTKKYSEAETDQDYTGCLGESIPDQNREQKVFKLCMDALLSADIVFAWLDDPTAYGTIFELGHAQARGKKIFISGPEKLKDMWFIYQGGQYIKANSPEEGLKIALEFSPIEQSFWNTWNHEKYLLKPQFKIFDGIYRIDFVHEPSMTAIELDGKQGHTTPTDIEKDRKRQRLIENLGWKFIRFPGKEIYKDPAACAKKAEAFISKRLK